MRDDFVALMTLLWQGKSGVFTVRVHEKNKLLKNLQDYNIISRHEVSFILNQYESDFITKRE